MGERVYSVAVRCNAGVLKCAYTAVMLLENCVRRGGYIYKYFFRYRIVRSQLMGISLWISVFGRLVVVVVIADELTD